MLYVSFHVIKISLRRLLRLLIIQRNVERNTYWCMACKNWLSGGKVIISSHSVHECLVSLESGHLRTRTVKGS